MSVTLPASNLFDLYYLSSEITNTFPDPPVRSIADFTLPGGGQQATIVNLAFGALNGSPDDFQAPYIDYHAFAGSFSSGDVAYLQQQGIKVVLTVGNTETMGWRQIPAAQNAAFAQWIVTELFQGLGLDGIDIDDENVGGPATALAATVSAMRAAFGADYIIKKALWEDYDVIPLIKDDLDLGSTMAYYDDLGDLTSNYQQYLDLGMPPGKVALGVQAGPARQNFQFTSLEVTRQATAWQPAGGTKLGMMLYSFSQDIQAFTAEPQHGPYPAANDHQWQKTIIDTMHGLSPAAPAGAAGEASAAEPSAAPKMAG